MFSISGVNSGLDVNALVDAIVAAERAPVENRLQRAEQDYTVELSALGQLQGAINGFSTAVDNLNQSDTFDTRKTSVTDSSVFTATATSSAAFGSYRIRVDQLASNHSIATAAFSDTDTFGTGNLVLDLGSDSMTLALDSNNNTLSGIRDAINAASDNPGINATLLNDGGNTRLLLTSEKTGLANTITLDTAGLTLGGGDSDIGTGTVELNAAQDATVVVGEGAGQLTITHSDNSIEDLIEGVTINLQSVNANFQTITIAEDINATKTKIESFVSAYNSLISDINALTLYQEGVDPGALIGDATVRSIQSQLRNAIGSTYSAGNISILSDFGITTSETDGTLSIDSATLNTTITDNYDNLSTFFTGSNAMAGTMAGILDTYDSSTGVIKTRMSSLETRIRDLEDDKADLDIRIANQRYYWEQQFLAMETLVGQYNSAGQYLSSILTNNNRNN
ncbi:flagellar filament capping protein FliD [Endozoicomonas sp. Mp262]|uniref:flagellar filament capping protein FliD n=1 Tax=Endozoicomonas sp. Mp262 TaxID=2919499 RepID=UPI0021DA6E13